MAGIAADDIHDAASPNELTVFADSFDAGAHFHGRGSFPAAG